MPCLFARHALAACLGAGVLMVGAPVHAQTGQSRPQAAPGYTPARPAYQAPPGGNTALPPMPPARRAAPGPVYRPAPTPPSTPSAPSRPTMPAMPATPTTPSVALPPAQPRPYGR